MKYNKKKDVIIYEKQNFKNKLLAFFYIPAAKSTTLISFLETQAVWMKLP